MYSCVFIMFKYLWACLLCWPCYVSSDYDLTGSQQPIAGRAAIRWDGDGGYVMFCLCMGRWFAYRCACVTNSTRIAAKSKSL